MDRADGTLILSATDLVGYLACQPLSVLDAHALARGTSSARRSDRELVVLRRRGLEEEAAYLAPLASAGLSVAKIDEPPSGPDRLAGLRRREAETVEAMRAGVDVVFQATFIDETAGVAWRGHADFLRKVEHPSRLGGHSYEPEGTNRHG
jgi:hypothetical protein